MSIIRNIWPVSNSVNGPCPTPRNTHTAAPTRGGTVPAVESTLDVNELERELCRIPEVTAARVVAGPTGHIEEVHILSLPLKHAKQVVRDVQSVAMATFGLDLDRRIVSVVQLDAPPGTVAPQPAPQIVPDAAETAEAEAAEAAGVPHAPTRPVEQPVVAAGPHGPDTDPTLAALAEALDVSVALPPATPAHAATNGVDTRINVDSVTATRSSHQATAEVVLSRGTDLSTGTAEGIGATNSVIRLVAQATISALRLLEPAATKADVEAAMVVNLGARQVALTTVVLVVPPYEEVCAGSAIVRSAGELDAVARAVLDATNRRLPQLR